VKPTTSVLPALDPHPSSTNDRIMAAPSCRAKGREAHSPPAAATGRSGRRPRRCGVFVEVGGVEPPSHEVSAPASPSAANSELSGREPLSARCPRPYPVVILTVGHRLPDGCILHCVARSGEAGTHRADRPLVVRRPVPDRYRHVCVSRLFCEDSGDLGSLPAPRPSRSKPRHPRDAAHRSGIIVPHDRDQRDRVTGPRLLVHPL